MRLRKNKKLAAVIVVAIILSALVFLAWPSKTVAPVKSNSPTITSPAPTNAAFNKNQYPNDIASSLWVVVNKGRQLPADYTPTDLEVPNVPLRLGASVPEMHVRADTARAMEAMFADAKAKNIALKLESGYRSYSVQVSVYGGYAASSGTTKADTFSARPGHSEHQTGLAADIEPLDRTCEVQQCFETTPEGKWLAENAYKYGFIIRYQKNTQELTGYEYEPWHVRYVGKDLAAQLRQSGQTLEQFFGLPVYTSYPSQSLQLKDK
jgi:D-alanyl-D-alanine carboxypeptidase